jgi:hypothetical protein
MPRASRRSARRPRSTKPAGAITHAQARLLGTVLAVGAQPLETGEEAIGERAS